MPYCTQCGSKNDYDARFCISCGSELSGPVPGPQLARNRNRTKGKSKTTLWVVILLFFILASVFTYMRLSKTNVIQTDDAEKAADVVESTPDKSEDISIPDVRERAAEIADRVFGSDQQLGELPRKPTPPKEGLTDVETSDNYHYQEENCDDLYTDIFQQGAYSIQQELLKVTKISEEEENRLGREIAKNIAKQHKGKLDVDKAWVNYLRKMGKHLVTGVNRKGIDYHFHVIRDDMMMNTFAAPGGGIYFFTGILNEIENEAQLAGIIAHEVKHVDLRHCIALYQVMSRLPQPAHNPLTFTVAQKMKHPYNARQEADADRRGLELAYSFGYSPYQIINFWEKDRGNKTEISEKIQSRGLGDIFGRVLDEVGNVLQTHPKDEKRACLMKNHILKLQKEYLMERFYVGMWNYQNKVPMFQRQK